MSEIELYQYLQISDFGLYQYTDVGYSIVPALKYISTRGPVGLIYHPVLYQLYEGSGSCS